MKKILFCICAALTIFCTQSFGQISANAGYLNSVYSMKSGKSTVTWKGNGFYAGLGTDISLNYAGISFSPGLYFDYVNYSLGDNSQATNYLLRAPLHFNLLYNVGKNADVFISGGPSLLYGLGGKVNYNILGGINYADDFYGDGDTRFDATLGFEGGVILSDVLKVVCGYDFGLINQTNDSDSVCKRNFLHIGIGYMF